MKVKSDLDKFKEIVELLIGKGKNTNAAKVQRSKRKPKNNMANAKPSRNTRRKIR